MTEPSPQSDATPAISTQGLYFRYDGSWVLEDIDLKIGPYDFAGLVGPNGGGKTTLLKIVLGLLTPERGSVRVFGAAPREASRHVGYVPQHIFLDAEFPITVMEVVLLGCLSRNPLGWLHRNQQRDQAREALAEVDMLAYRGRPFGALSGGQRQRVLIARALVNQPRLLLMDEPTANVDSLSQQQIYDLLHRINERCAIILVSHDLGVVTSHATRVACLNRKLVTHDAHAVTDSLIQQMYGAHVHFVDHASGHGHHPAQGS